MEIDKDFLIKITKRQDKLEKSQRDAFLMASTRLNGIETRLTKIAEYLADKSSQSTQSASNTYEVEGVMNNPQQIQGLATEIKPILQKYGVLKVVATLV